MKWYDSAWCRAEDSTLNRMASAAGRERGGRASVTGAPTGHSLRKRGTRGTQASAARSDPGTVSPSATEKEAVSEVTPTGDSEGREGASLADESVSHDVWCVLVFRMICWLLLHNFNKQDVQVSKSELVGSRMPVYIA